MVINITIIVITIMIMVIIIIKRMTVITCFITLITTYYYFRWSTGRNEPRSPSERAPWRSSPVPWALRGSVPESPRGPLIKEYLGPL